MATVQAAVKARLIGAALEQITGYPVSIDYKQDYVSVYWSGNDIAGVRDKIQELAESGPGDVRINFAPVIFPYIIKKAVPWVVVFGAVCFYLGRRF